MPRYPGNTSLDTLDRFAPDDLKEPIGVLLAQYSEISANRLTPRLYLYFLRSDKSAIVQGRGRGLELKRLIVVHEIFISRDRKLMWC